MKYKWIDEYCSKLPGAEKEFQEDWQAFKFVIRGKMFALLGEDKNENPILTVKLSPLVGEALRQEYEDVVPGYYMNKTHWNSFYLEGLVPQEIIENSLGESYELVLHALPKKMQAEITAKTEV